MARSHVWVRKKTVPHVNDPLVHLVACVRVHGRVLDMLFIQSLISHTVPGFLVLIALLLHLRVVGVDDGLGEVNHEVLLLPIADDLLLLLDVDKLVAPDGRIIAFFLLSTVVKMQSALLKGSRWT